MKATWIRIRPNPFTAIISKSSRGKANMPMAARMTMWSMGIWCSAFALVAYPAKYGVSGIMTFIINQEGVIYEKDLGENTSTAAAAMTSFDPDDTWHKYEEPAGQ